jgi:type I restriction enzyme S subunit
MVEWKKLGEVCEIGTGSNNREDACDNGCYPFYVRSQEVLKIDSYSYDEEAILIPGEGGIGDIFHYINGKYGLHQRTYRVHPITDDVKGRYIYYFLFANFKTYINAKSYKSTAASIRKPMLLDFPIPIPSLEEQTRIVGILDTFTSAIDNLKEQIAQRRKQYEYYRDQLLNLEGKPGVEMKTLGEIGEFIRGNGIQKSDFVEDGYSCIHYGQIHAKYGFSATETLSKIEKSLYDKCKKAKKGDVVLATTSEDAEGVAKPFVWLGDEDAAVSGDAFIYHHNQIGKFMGFQFQTHKFMQFKVKYATGAKVVRISGDNMAKFEVALPPLSEQQRIVSILDTFEASIQNLEALLKEREKQYEYYRNKLLSFE